MMIDLSLNNSGITLLHDNQEEEDLMVTMAYAMDHYYIICITICNRHDIYICLYQSFPYCLRVSFY